MASNPKKVKQTPEIESNEENFYDLSATLIERRKRLHELATEINKWENESSTTFKNIISPSITNSNSAKTPLTLDFTNKVTHNPFKSATTTSKNDANSINVTNRTLSKKKSNSSLNLTSTNNSQSLVQSIKSKFENIASDTNKLEANSQNETQTDLTPRSIIKKFEQMSREVSQSAPLTKKINSTSNIPQKCDSTPLTIKSTTSSSNVSHKEPESSLLSTDNLKPKSIIEKFESMVRNNEKQLQTNSACYSTSLTYISSINGAEDYDLSESSVEVEQRPKAKFLDEEEAIYEELGTDLIAKEKDGTSLFEENDEETQPSSITTTYNTQGTYSISASSYTGSLMNQEEFEQDETENDDYDDEEYSEEEEYDSINEYETNNQTEESLSSQQSTCNDTTIKQSSIELAYSADSSNPPCTSSDIGSSSVESASSKLINEQLLNEPLFSIKEYRKQKRFNSGRRSSIASKTLNNKDLSTVAKIAKTKPSSVCSSSDSGDLQIKQAKYSERIKELDELIKQEDNIIHQTGIALERCITDSQFTGTSEHIECNRLLLISCQKRQAYSGEINRLRNLINSMQSSDTNSLESNLSTSSNENSSSIESDISPTDLTGLLIFSDLQLPIKESYINKIKSGDEKRIFYFLCLIRNGIQVLQTQVISVQELIATRETCLIFPNRMAINNVDINFKVKIDIYTLEVVPKDSKACKQTIGTHTTSKFFSPFKFHAHSSNSCSSATNSNQGIYSSSNHHHFNEQSNLSSHGAKTSNFIHVDTIEITQRDISKNKFKLSISSSSIPLTGLLYVNVRCMPSKSIELKGFMTLFEDSSSVSFGTWDRRWCFLNNYNISYWKYPEDEFRNGPLGVINLTKCTNEKVSILPRDLCARKYTIELFVQDDTGAQNPEENKSNGYTKPKRFRLSADSKEQAAEWVTHLNFALANLRLWNPKTSKR